MVKKQRLERGRGSIAKEYEISAPGSLKGQRKQYGLKHHVTSKVHACQGDTLHRVATEVSYGNSLYKLWGKGQVVVLLSSTRLAIELIFVGDKRERIECLVSLIQVKTKFMDYMEKVMLLMSLTTQDDMIPRRQESQGPRSI